MNQNTSEGTRSSSTRPIYNKEGIFKLCLACISALLAAFTGIFFGFDFDVESMYFRSASSSYILGAVMTIAVAGMAVLSIILKANLSPVRRKGTTLLQYLSAITLFLLFLQSIMDRSIWLVIFSLIAIAYFIGLFNRHYAANTALGIGAVLFCGVCIAQTYFDYSIAVNSPYKLLCQLGMAISMLLIANELRFDLDGGKPASYRLVSALTFILNISAVAAGIALVILDAKNINYCFIPCAVMAIYSARIFFARSKSTIEAPDTDTTPDEKGTDTDENVN